VSNIDSRLSVPGQGGTTVGAEPGWIKSSRSAGNGNCVEVAFRKSSSCGGGECVEVAIGDQVFVRDSKDPDGPRLAFASGAWAEFVAGVVAGEFDLTT
jgi:hypothetical protein